MKKCFLLALICLFVSLAFAQKSEVFRIDSLPAQGILLDKGWKFQVADSQVFANPNFDDSKWESIDPTKDIVLDLPQIPKDGKIVWFRLRFSLDSAINQPLALALQQSGASEIYLNGTLIKRIGIIHENPKLIKAYNPYNFPIAISINKETTQILAIRYALQPDISYGTHFGTPNSGFTIRLNASENAIEFYTNNLYFHHQGQFPRIGIFGILGILFFTLYLFFPTQKASLYFSLYAFIYAVSWWFFIQVNKPNFKEVWYIYNNLIVILQVISYLLMLTSVYTILEQKRTWFYWFLIALGIFCIPTAAFIYGWGWFFFGFLISNLITVDITRVALLALRNNKKGAWIILVGGTFYFISWAIFCLQFLGIIQIDFNFFEISILSIPVTFAIFLGYDTAVTSRLLEKKLVEVETLSSEKQQILENQKVELEKQVKERTLELQETNEELNTTLHIVEQERQKSDNLLLNILPEETAQELKATGQATPKHYDLVSVLFTDFKGFSQIAEKLSPQEVIENLNTCFLALDEICERHNLEKIKTIGDSYMCAGGIPVANASNPLDCVQAGLEMQAWMANWKAEKQAKGELAWELRLGIHSGAVVAGVIGKNKFAYDIWGDAVNLASRMESSGEAGKVNISGATYELVKDKFQCTYRGKIEAKNKGEVEMYFVEGIK
jgi:class 3 adenylate cyclase